MQSSLLNRCSNNAFAVRTSARPSLARVPIVRLQASNKPVMFGLDASEGVFGFKPFAELWTGRLAMMGFLTSMIQEAVTGKGTLAQISLMEPGQPDFVVLGLLCAVFGGATLVASADTLNKLRNKQLTPADVARYKNFLSLNKENDYKVEAAAMKARGDFTTPGNDLGAISAAKADGTPVDAFLSTNEVAEGSAEARQMKMDASPAPKRDVLDDLMMSPDSEFRYALDVEMRNGRWAMLGFLAAILVEAGTGNGILGQIIAYLKVANILGADSGF